MIFNSSYPYKWLPIKSKLSQRVWILIALCPACRTHDATDNHFMYFKKNKPKGGRKLRTQITDIFYWHRVDPIFHHIQISWLKKIVYGNIMENETQVPQIYKKLCLYQKQIERGNTWKSRWTKEWANLQQKWDTNEVHLKEYGKQTWAKKVVGIIYTHM